MKRASLRLLFISLLGLFGDPAHLWRISLCVFVGAIATVPTYWLWPAVLPAWPGAMMLAGSAIVGIAWEWRASP